MRERAISFKGMGQEEKEGIIRAIEVASPDGRADYMRRIIALGGIAGKFVSHLCHVRH